MRNDRSSYIILFFVLSLPLYILDQGTKYAVIQFLGMDEMLPVIPNFFDLVHVRNTGAAFSMFSGANVFFIALSIVALVVLVFLASRDAFETGIGRYAWALLVSGILGNLTDRILHGAVIDFLSFNFHIRFANPWPSFNVADACICTASVFFIIASFRQPKEERPVHYLFR